MWVKQSFCHRRCWCWILVGVLGLMVSHAALAAGESNVKNNWKTVREDKGRCQLSIPSDWSVVMPGMGLVQDPMQKASAAFQTDSENSWNELKATAKNLLKATAVQEDSANRFAFVYGKTGAHYYLAKRFTGFNCVAQVDLNDAIAVQKYGSIAKRIIDSLDKAP